MQSFATPERVLRTEQMNPGFLKIFIEESGRPFHYFSQAGDQYPHDHTFGMVSHMVVGGYEEEVFTIDEDGSWSMELRQRLPGTSHHIAAGSIHRITGLLAGHALTHVEPGPWEKEWFIYDFRPDGVYRCRPDAFGDWQPWPWA